MVDLRCWYQNSQHEGEGSHFIPKTNDATRPKNPISDHRERYPRNSCEKGPNGRWSTPSTVQFCLVMLALFVIKARLGSPAPSMALFRRHKEDRPGKGTTGLETQSRNQTSNGTTEGAVKTSPQLAGMPKRNGHT